MNADGAGRGPSVAVVGAGMAGLAAAWRLQRAGLGVAVLEREARVGGRVLDVDLGSLWVGAGPQFLTNFYAHTLDLIGELDLQADLVRIPGGCAVVHGGALHPVWPSGRLLTSRLVSVRGKLDLLKLAWELARHWRELDLDALHEADRLDTRSMAAYARAQLSDDLVQRLLRPALEGFLYCTPDQTSQAMLLALTKGGAGLRTLLTLRGGLGQLPEAIAVRLTVTCGAEVRAVRTGPKGGYEVIASLAGHERRLAVDGVVCTTSASVVPGLFPDLDPRRRAFFEAVRYVPVLTVAVNVRRRLPPEFYGLLFPRQESRRLALAAVESAKLPQKLPSAQDIATLYSSPEATAELLGEDDAVVRDALLADLARAGSAYDLTGDLLVDRVHRWHQALPEFGVGHFRRLRAFARGEVEWGRVVFAGDYLGGPLVEGAVTSGLHAADRLLGRLAQDGGRGRLSGR
jgi:oxygen-dependent protoporphyrinogen oxidase